MSSHGPYEKGWPKSTEDAYYATLPSEEIEVVPLSDAERLREALEAIAHGNWGGLLAKRYWRYSEPGVTVHSQSVPRDSEIRFLARAALNPEPVSTPQGEDEGG